MLPTFHAIVTETLAEFVYDDEKYRDRILQLFKFQNLLIYVW